MKKVDREKLTYEILFQVLKEGAYSSIALDNELNNVESIKDRAYITRLFYGILEKNITLDYIISSLTTKKPNIKIELVLKIGIYLLRYSSTPTYACIDKTVDLVKKIGKGGLSGFINATLRRSQDILLPKKDEVDDTTFMSINYSVPKWLCGKLIKRNGFSDTQEFLSCTLNQKTHIRYRNVDNKIGELDRYSLGYYLTSEELSTLKKSSYAKMSLSSMLAVNFYAQGIKNGDKVLDLCASPGGKSIYLMDMIDNLDITACDIYPHRTELIEKYAKAMGVRLKTLCNDATIFKKEWQDSFDSVICDVPCSGIGVIKSKPDILLNRKPEDILSLANIQYNIINTAKFYVKVGGYLNYSTCTIMREENSDIIDKFLANNENFVIEKILSPLADNNGVVNLLPHKHGCDGFFVTKLKRIK